MPKAQGLFRRVCELLDRAIMAVCVGFLVVIVAIIFAEITYRATSGRPVPDSQEIAQMSLVWLTFLGAAVAWRHNRHIMVELEIFDGGGLGRVVTVFATLISAVCTVVLAWVIVGMYPMLSRLTVGALGVSRFDYGFLPLQICCGVTALFCLERLLIGLPPSLTRADALHGEME